MSYVVAQDEGRIFLNSGSTCQSIYSYLITVARSIQPNFFFKLWYESVTSVNWNPFKSKQKKERKKPQDKESEERISWKGTNLKRKEHKVIWKREKVILR